MTLKAFVPADAVKAWDEGGYKVPAIKPRTDKTAHEILLQEILGITPENPWKYTVIESKPCKHCQTLVREDYLHCLSCGQPRA